MKAVGKQTGKQSEVTAEVFDFEEFVAIAREHSPAWYRDPESQFNLYTDDGVIAIPYLEDAEVVAAFNPNSSRLRVFQNDRVAAFVLRLKHYSRQQLGNAARLATLILLFCAAMPTDWT